MTASNMQFRGSREGPVRGRSTLRSRREVFRARSPRRTRLSASTPQSKRPTALSRRPPSGWTSSAESEIVLGHGTNGRRAIGSSGRSLSSGNLSVTSVGLVFEVASSET
ncbi:MAG: hypothetical protein BGO98_35965 [Myxococcales bacterium 68-20]|nr:MAG: hypothetical protein BGO98_35965 [Myxococcales bacterium 68-20]